MPVTTYQKAARQDLKARLDQIARLRERARVADELGMPAVAAGAIEGIEPLRREAARLYREAYP